MSEWLRLLGDIGATHARFAVLCRDSSIQAERKIAVASHERFADAISTLSDEFPAAGKAARSRLCHRSGRSLAIRIAMLNAPWRFSLAALKREFGWSALHVVNDFAANALSVPHLDPPMTAQIGQGASAPNQTIAVLGPGTGLGVAGLVRAHDGWIAVAGEGARPPSPRSIRARRRSSTFCAANMRMCRPRSCCRGRASSISTMRCASLPGGRKPRCLRVCDQSLSAATHKRARRSVFCAMLGTFAGSVALTYGGARRRLHHGRRDPENHQFFRNSDFRSVSSSRDAIGTIWIPYRPMW